MKLESIKDFFVTQYGIITSNRFGIFGAVILIFFALVAILAPWIAPHDLWESLRDSNGKLAMLRPPSLEFPLGTTAMGLTFTGLSLLPLPEVTAIGYATPIFTLILAALLLGERIRLIRIGAVAIGLLGVLIMIWPRLGSADLGTGATIGALCVLGATVARGFVQIHIRQLVQVDHPAAIVFYFSMTATLLSALTVFWGWTMPTLNQLLILITMGLIGGVAQILVTSSYRFGQASMLAPYDYTSMLFAIFIGYVWFDELPTLAILLGAALVIAGNAVVIWREHQLGLERGKARSLTDHKP